ncbi:MAG: alpha-glucosidase [Ethanoligenens sp.]
MQKKWWQSAIAYQIYPKSFLDTNGDGIGDLGGILQKLDYIASLGVNVIWLSPVFQSPMVDNGYDISDYRHIDPMFGTDEEMEYLIEQADKRGIKILMDLVVNHTSDQHPWFQEALRDPHSKYADYYLFRETDDGNPPNNLRNYFSTPAWTRVPHTNRWYFHAFAPEQPDLNWDNPAVRKEIADMVNWWLDKGLGGFRIDAISNIKKSPLALSRQTFEADAPDGTVLAKDWVANQPGIEVFLEELAARTFRPHNSMTVAEADVPPELLEAFIGPEGAFSMTFDFTYADIDIRDIPPYAAPTFTVADLRAAIFHSQLHAQKIGGWSAPFLENHDQPRSLDKYIPQNDIGYASATMLATLLLTLKGTPFIYQGEELGMTNCPMTLDEYDDLSVYAQNEQGLKWGFSAEWMLAYFNRRSRDNARTPFQWNSGPNAGFTTGKPWLKVNPNYTKINAKQQIDDPASVLNFYKRLLALRRGSTVSDILTYGNFEPLDCIGNIIAYRRTYENHSVLILLNFGGKPVDFKLPQQKELLVNFDSLEWHDGLVTLMPYQAALLDEA